MPWFHTARNVGCVLKPYVHLPVVRRATALAGLLTVLLLILATWLAAEYIRSPILGFHYFRQTQTALTSYWTCRSGFHLAYWTPVGGFPWSIPFEFPIYQWIVSSIACPLGLNLDAIGRMVSYLFWIACLWPAWLICRRLFAPSAGLYFWIFSALFLSSPLYLFWGRSFLIETASLFFALAYLAFSLEMSFGEDRWADAILSGIFLTLAVLQKSTTVVPLLLFGFVYLHKSWNDLWHNWFRSARLWKGVIGYIVPVAIGMSWVRYSDHIKMANPLGRLLTSHELTTWNFGLLDQRFSKALWHDAIWDSGIALNTGYVLGLCIILAGFALAPRWRALIAWGVGLFLLFYMVFENLFFQHQYYLEENAVYLIFALAVAIGGLIETWPKLSPIVLIAFIGVITINLHAFFSGPLFADESRQFDDSNPRLAVARFVKARTMSDSPILIYGDDWDSSIPYYSQHPAFAVPRFFSPYLAPLDAPERYLDHGPGAVLICNSARDDADVKGEIAERFSTWPKTGLSICDVYLRRDTQPVASYNPAR
jgi:hypothetical protein